MKTAIPLGTKKQPALPLFLLVAVAVIGLTPFLPMPKNPGGFLSPLFYLSLGLIALLDMLLSGRLPGIFSLRYTWMLLGLNVALLAIDVLGLSFFTPSEQIKTVIGRTALLSGFFGLIYAAGLASKYSRANPDTFMRYLRWLLLAWSMGLLLLCLLIFLEGTGIVSSGFERANRTFFGVTLPFRKATGVEMSDGKLGTMIVPLLWLLVINSFERYRVVHLPFRRLQIILLSLAVLIAQSRSTWLGVAVSGFVLVLLLPGIRYKKLLYVIGTPLALLVFLLGIPAVIIEGFVGEGAYARNVDARGAGIVQAAAKWLESPVWGIGRENMIFQLDKNREYIIHNFFLDQLGAAGLVGFVPLLLMFVLFFVAAFRLRRKGVALQNRWLTVCSVWLIVSMIHIVIELNLYRGFYNEYIYFYFALLLAAGHYAAVVQREISHEKT